MEMRGRSRRRCEDEMEYFEWVNDKRKTTTNEKKIILKKANHNKITTRDHPDKQRKYVLFEEKEIIWLSNKLMLLISWKYHRFYLFYFV